MYVDMRTVKKLRLYLARVNRLDALIEKSTDEYFTEIFLKIKWDTGTDEDLKRSSERVNTFLNAVRDLSSIGKEEYNDLMHELPQVQDFEVIRGGQTHEY